MFGFQQLQEILFKIGNFVFGYILQQAVCAAEYDCDLFLYRQGSVLVLFQDFHVLRAFVQYGLGRRVYLGAEFGESFQFTVLCLVEFQCPGNFFHAFDLGVSTYTGYRYSDIDCGTHSFVEQVRFQKYLSVGDRNHVCRNVSRHVACLCFDNRQCCNRPSAFYHVFYGFGNVVHLTGHVIVVDDFRGTLQQTGMKVENIAGICFTSGRTAQDQGNFAVCDGLF